MQRNSKRQRSWGSWWVHCKLRKYLWCWILKSTTCALWKFTLDCTKDLLGRSPRELFACFIHSLKPLKFRENKIWCLIGPNSSSDTQFTILVYLGCVSSTRVVTLYCSIKYLYLHTCTTSLFVTEQPTYISLFSMHLNIDQQVVIKATHNSNSTLNPLSYLNPNITLLYKKSLHPKFPYLQLKLNNFTIFQNF